MVLGFVLWVLWGRCSPKSSLEEVLHYPGLIPDLHSFASASPCPLRVPELHHPHAEGFRMLWSHRIQHRILLPTGISRILEREENALMKDR